jgi:N-acetyl-gamma-glutamyl-phosphate reductase
MGTTAAVLGASGYTGGELLRVLEDHPSITVTAASGERAAGREVSEVHPHLAGTDLPRLVTLERALESEVNVVFSCLPSGSLGAHLGSLGAGIVIDLADDFRADPSWTYGLTEFARATLGERVANPGCYPTAVLLCLLPFARAGLIEGPVIVDAFSGTSGAGRKEQDHLLFAAAHGNVGGYGTTVHRHVPEMERYLESFGGLSATVSFTPHLIPIARGLTATVRARLVAPLDDPGALAVLQQAYADEIFVTAIEGWPQSKSVAGSNQAHVSARVDERASLLVCSAAIDNLGKGAAGQAVQNANVVLGLDEGLGLETVGVWP